MRLSGNRPVEWTRDRADADAVVQLAAGYNLVSWMEEDQAALDQALNGVGSPLRGAGVWSGDSDSLVYRTAAEFQQSDQSLPVGLGAALWVNVDRSTYWLQSDLAPTHIHWFTYPEVNTNRNKQGTATIQYGGGSFYQLISRLSVEGCEVINLVIDDLEYDFRHTRAQNLTFRTRYQNQIEPGAQAKVHCVDNCNVVYAGSLAPARYVAFWRDLDPSELCITLPPTNPELSNHSTCGTNWSTVVTSVLLRIPVYQDLCHIDIFIEADSPFHGLGGQFTVNMVFLQNQILVQAHETTIYVLVIGEGDEGYANDLQYVVTSLHEICHVHQSWYTLKEYVGDDVLNRTRATKPGTRMPTSTSDLWYSTRKAIDFIELTGFETDEDGLCMLSAQSKIKGRSKHTSEDPQELSADVCAYYLLKRLRPHDLGDQARYTKPPYLTEELERWVEQYIVLPE